MAEQEISIKIKPDGTVDIDLIGYKGDRTWRRFRIYRGD